MNSKKINFKELKCIKYKENNKNNNHKIKEINENQQENPLY